MTATARKVACLPPLSRACHGMYVKPALVLRDTLHAVVKAVTATARKVSPLDAMRQRDGVRRNQALVLRRSPHARSPASGLKRQDELGFVLQPLEPKDGNVVSSRNRFPASIHRSWHAATSRQWLRLCRRSRHQDRTHRQLRSRAAPSSTSNGKSLGPPDPITRPSPRCTRNVQAREEIRQSTTRSD